LGTREGSFETETGGGKYKHTTGEKAATCASARRRRRTVPHSCNHCHSTIEKEKTTRTCTSTQTKKIAAKHCPPPRTAHHLLPTRSNTTRNRALHHHHRLPLSSPLTTAPREAEGANRNREEQS